MKTFSASMLSSGPAAVSPIFDGEAAVYSADEFATALALLMLLFLYPNVPNPVPTVSCLNYKFISTPLQCVSMHCACSTVIYTEECQRKRKAEKYTLRAF